MQYFFWRGLVGITDSLLFFFGNGKKIGKTHVLMWGPADVWQWLVALVCVYVIFKNGKMHFDDTADCSIKLKKKMVKKKAIAMLKFNSSSYFAEKKIPQTHETYSGDFPRTDTMNSNIH